jgi:hypothetical protein
MKEIGYDPDKIMTNVIEKMLRCANMMQFHLFSLWKNSTFTDKARRALMKKNRYVTKLVDDLQRKHDKHLKAGFNAIAMDSLNTKTKQSIIGRLSKACYGRLQAAYDTWKYDTFQELKAAMERKKARIIDDLIRNSMSPLQKAFYKWSVYLRAMQKYEYGEQVKAGYALHALVTRFYRDRKREYCMFALRKIGFNPDRLMRASF